ncbi:damage-inducible protein CinA [Planctomycetales bacterium]|nr:damage-inducible protein CinA [Planctomycetales bacterium]
MQAEIISNGDELISGKILDTNSQWLSLELDDLGVETLYHTTVGDDLNAMVGVLKTAMQRADIVIWTGGLGPTADDLTRQAVADAAGVPLVEDADSLRLIQEMFQRRGSQMPKSNEIQAFQPKGAKPIYNPHGTAPGIDFVPPSNDRCKRFLAYPGVPAELKEMWNDTGRQTVREVVSQNSATKSVIRFRSIHSFGFGESHIEAMLPGIIDRKRVPKVGITASQATITLRIIAEAATEAECFEKMKPTADWIYRTLGDCIYGENEDTLQSVVLKNLQKTNKTLAAVEAGTSGLLAARLNQEQSKTGTMPLHFLGGAVLPQRTPVTPEEMIKIGRRIFNPDYFLLVGNYPPGEPDRNRKDEVFAAVVDNAVVDNKAADFSSTVFVAKNYPFVGHPALIDELYVKRALDLFRRRE